MTKIYLLLAVLLLAILGALTECGWLTNPSPIKQGFIQSAQFVTIYEQSGSIATITFSTGDVRLMEDISEGPGVYDFRGVFNEYYDVYISDADGTPDSNGDYLTIQCFRDAFYTDDNVGNNIDAVALDFAEGSRFFASFIAKVETGSGLIDLQYILTEGFAQRALGPPDGFSTRLGDQYSSITLGFRLNLKREGRDPSGVPDGLLRRDRP